MAVEIPTDRPVHTTTLKVRFYELDPYDHVNHTNYFAYFETARIEFLSELGFGLDVLKERGFQKVVVEIKARFAAAAQFGDELSVHTWIGSVGRVRSTWHQVLLRGDELIAQVEVIGALTDLEGRPRRIPEEFVEKVGALAP